jgi:hypothetical protein
VALLKKSGGGPYFGGGGTPKEVMPKKEKAPVKPFTQNPNPKPLRSLDHALGFGVYDMFAKNRLRVERMTRSDTWHARGIARVHSGDYIGAYPVVGSPVGKSRPRAPERGRSRERRTRHSRARDEWGHEWFEGPA